MKLSARNQLEGTVSRGGDHDAEDHAEGRRYRHFLDHERSGPGTRSGGGQFGDSRGQVIRRDGGHPVELSPRHSCRGLAETPEVPGLDLDVLENSL